MKEENAKNVLTVVDNGKPLTNSDMLNELSRAEKILNVIGNGVEKVNFYIDTVQEIFTASYNVLRNAVLSGEKINVPALEPIKNKHIEIDLTENLFDESWNIIKPGGDFDDYHWEENETPQNELDKATEFLESKGYHLCDVKPTEWMPEYTYEKYVEVDGVKYNRTTITIYASDGEIYI